MSQKQPVKGQRGAGAKGQGKLTYYQTSIVAALRRSKERLGPKRGEAHIRDAKGHWV